MVAPEALHLREISEANKTLQRTGAVLCRFGNRGFQFILSVVQVSFPAPVAELGSLRARPPAYARQIH